MGNNHVLTSLYYIDFRKMSRSVMMDNGIFGVDLSTCTKVYPEVRYRV